MESDGGGRHNKPGGRGLRASDRDLVKRLIQLRCERRIVGKERQRKSEVPRGLDVRGGLRLDEVKGFACRVKVLLQYPMLNLRAAIGELDFEELILDGGDGLDGGGDLRRCAGGLCGCGRWRRTRRGLGCRRGRLGLSYSGRLLFRLGLVEEVLIAEKSGEHNQHKGHSGAHVATATTTAGALRLQIGIVNFGQRKLPIVSRGQPTGRPLYLW